MIDKRNLRILIEDLNIGNTYVCKNESNDEGAEIKILLNKTVFDLLAKNAGSSNVDIVSEYVLYCALMLNSDLKETFKGHDNAQAKKLY